MEIRARILDNGTEVIFMQEKNYRLAALDMDGTLLNSQHTVSQYTRDVLSRADACGKIIALATGRCLSELREFIDTIPAIRYIICENGACVYDTRRKQSIHRVSIAPEHVEFILRELEAQSVLLQIFMEDQSYICAPLEIDLNPYHLEFFRSVFEAGSIFDPNLYDRYRAHRPAVDKIDLYFTSEADRRDFLSCISSLDLAIAGSLGIGLELSPPNTNKAAGLLSLCSLLGISTEDAIAVGDADNDRAILKAAGLAVAMGNALDEIKTLADVITDDCDHDGAAKAVERFLL